MGVPAFFRWLSRKYPSVIIECTENKTYGDNGEILYEDPMLPNPNGTEFDNLYLDMNGIIHPCTHPEDKPAPKNEDEMMVAIFECIDRLFGIVRPRKVLYMAIDGVAPRAKMNQQRSRRFRASKETMEKAAEVERIKDQLRMKGAVLPPEKEKGEHFDSNCITPGTPFMDKLSRCLVYYIHDRIKNNPAWQGIQVILSDANVPGEGEHKIMDFIRKQRVQADYDPNTHHVLCGADADLIMLGLATHEAQFTIIREEFLPNKPRPCDICRQMGHEMKDCVGLDSSEALRNSADIEIGKEVQFIFVRLSVLREYLEKELAMPNLPFEYNFDRVLDDWVFMCFFVGNDFLPHLPSLEIREGAVDRLVALYKKCVYKTGGYLTDSGEVALDRVELIMTDLGYVEDEIFKNRQQSEIRYKANLKRRKLQEQQKQQRPNFTELHKNPDFAPVALGRGPQQPHAVHNARQEAAKFRMSDEAGNSQRNLEDMVRPGQKRPASTPVEQLRSQADSDEEPNDEVRLWEDGFKSRYYESKFDVTADNLQFRNSVALQYVRGLCWVLKYYYQGCASWEWYFPYHYAPFASDFQNISGLSTEFDRGTPFNPFEQLMSVFPAASRSHVPAPFAELMLDPKSTIIDFYPEDFKIDLNGKKFAWQGVALLPFVDEKRLFKAIKPFYSQLTEEEKKRNTNGDDWLFLGRKNDGFNLLKKLYEASDLEYGKEMPISIKNLNGYMMLTDRNVAMGGSLASPVRGLEEVTDNSVFTVQFRNPKFADTFIFPARKLPKAKPVLRVLGADEGPVIGFQPHNQRQRATLDASGHRAVNFHARDHQQGNYGDRGGGQRDRYQPGGQRQYGSFPPPNFQRGAGAPQHQQNRNYNQQPQARSFDNRGHQQGRNYDNHGGGYQSRGGGGGGGGSGGGGSGGGGGGYRGSGSHRPPYGQQQPYGGQQQRRY